MVVQIVPVCMPAFHAYLNSCNAHVRNKRRGTSSEAANDIAVTGVCTDCHGGHLSGGPISGAPPEFPPAANLTPSGDLAHWSDADIVRALREGARPDGAVLNPSMPWKATRSMTDDEIAALIRYLRSIPARSYHSHE